jgi:hypothetical protein
VDWSEANRQYLAAALLEVRRHLEARVNPDGPTTPSQREEMDALARAMPRPPAVQRLQELFGLSDFERDVVLMCAAIELDASFGRMCTAAQGGDPRLGQVTFGLALSCLPSAHWSALGPQAPLRDWRLIEVKPGPALTASPLVVDERILHYLAGVECTDQRLATCAREVQTPDDQTVVPSHADIALEAAKLIAAAVQQGQPVPCIQLCSPDTADSEAIAAEACRLLGVRLYALDAESIPTAAADLASFQKVLSRESLLARAAVVLRCHEIDAGDRSRSNAVSALIERGREPLMALVRDRRPIGQRPNVTFEVSRPSRVEQRAIWTQALNGAAHRLGPDQLEVVIGQFNLSATTIRSVGAAVAAPIERLEAEGARAVVWQACRSQSRPRLEDLAQHIPAIADWDSLVLPDAQRQILREIAVHVRHRVRVYETWGFETRGSRGLGISALFAGTSGTGKTMAAEVLAGELHLDLFRIDLSSVVSKYIGETEKNLRRVFDAAEDGGAILLFDEADALFGKRSEVKDSHDRYANIEVGYLLQRMEAYRGLAILTTNLKSALDPAFLRRIRFVVQFPFPDAVQRAEIWRRAFPSATPTAGLDPASLAQLNVAGGNIRNIALNAAFLAADADEPVRMRHVLTAARAEYAKLDKVLSDVEISGWVK